jgi:hypothetical protein
MGVSILSYDGRIQFGVITDVGLVPDPNEIVGRFGDEYEKLMWLTLMSPWGQDPDDVPDALAAAGTSSSAESKTRAKAKGAGAKLSNKPAQEKATPPIPKRFRNL